MTKRKEKYTGPEVGPAAREGYLLITKGGSTCVSLDDLPELIRILQKHVPKKATPPCALCGKPSRMLLHGVPDCNRLACRLPKHKGARK